MEGDFKDICLFIIHKISPNPSFPKRGIMRLDQKTIYKQTLFSGKFLDYLKRSYESGKLLFPGCIGYLKETDAFG
jgi:hypothetical protein